MAADPHWLEPWSERSRAGNLFFAVTSQTLLIERTILGESAYVLPLACPNENIKKGNRVVARPLRAGLLGKALFFFFFFPKAELSIIHPLSLLTLFIRTLSLLSQKLFIQLYSLFSLALPFLSGGERCHRTVRWLAMAGQIGPGSGYCKPVKTHDHRWPNAGR